MKHGAQKESPIEKWANAIAEQWCFTASDKVWEMIWLEVLPPELENYTLHRGVLNALWYISEYLFQEVYISQKHLEYWLTQDATLSANVRGANTKTIAGILSEVWEVGWLSTRRASELMQECGYTEAERKRSGINGNARYVTHNDELARTNMLAIRKTAISVRSEVTSPAFTDWLRERVLGCEEVASFDRYVGTLLNSNAPRDGCMQRVADLIRARLKEFGYEPAPDKNMRPLRGIGEPAVNPRSGYQSDAADVPIYFSAEYLR